MRTRWIAAKGREIRRNLSFPWDISQNPPSPCYLPYRRKPRLRCEAADLMSFDPSFFGRIHPVNHSELLQQLPVAVVETDDSGELRAISPFMLDHVTPNLDLAKQQRRAWRNKCILRP